MTASHTFLLLSLGTGLLASHATRAADFLFEYGVGIEADLIATKGRMQGRAFPVSGWIS